MPHPGDHTSIGYSYKRDHRPILPVRRRNIVGGMRDEDPDAFTGGDWIGDDINWAYWAANLGEDAPPAEAALTGPAGGSVGGSGATRSIGGWSIAWPVEKDGPDSARPLWRAARVDERFVALMDVTDAGALPGGAPTSEQFISVDGVRHPAGTAGVILAGTHERAQENLFVPVATPLIAHHADDDPPAYSTPVADMDGARRSDTARAGLHAAWWVRPYPLAPNVGPWDGEWGLAWVLRQAAGDTTGYRLTIGRGDGAWFETIGTAGDFVDPRTGYDIRVIKFTTRRDRDRDGPAGNTLGLASRERFGPLHVGHASNDKHRYGANADGEACNSLHLDTNAYWYRNRVEDGPLAFSEREYPKPVDFEQPVRVYLSWRHDVEHRWEEPRFGKWEWWTTSPWLEPIPPIDTPPTETPPTERPPVITPGERIEPPTGQPGGTDGDAPNANGARPIPPVMLYDLIPGFNVASDWSPARCRYELAFPSWMPTAARWGEKQPYDGRLGDMQRSVKGGVEDGVKGALDRATEEVRRAARRASSLFAPIVAHVQAFGAIDDHGAWDYTVAPPSEGSRNTGTADGGLWFTEPERLLDGLEPNATSNTIIALAPALGLQWGNPVTTGGVVDGPRLRAQGGTGANDLTLDFLDDAGALRDGQLSVRSSLSIGNSGGDKNGVHGYWSGTVGGVLQVYDDTNTTLILDVNGSETDGVAINGTLHVTGKCTFDDEVDPTAVRFAAQSAVPTTPGSSEGSVWVKNTTPSTLVFTDGAADDLRVMTVRDRELAASVTADASVTASATETAGASHTIAAGALEVGDVVEVEAHGESVGDATSNVDVTLRVRIGGISGTVLTTRTATLPATTTREWFVRVAFVVRAIGASGAIRCTHGAHVFAAAGGTPVITRDAHTNHTLDTTAAQSVVVSMQHSGTAAATSTLTYATVRHSKRSV